MVAPPPGYAGPNTLGARVAGGVETRDRACRRDGAHGRRRRCAGRRWCRACRRRAASRRTARVSTGPRLRSGDGNVPAHVRLEADRAAVEVGVLTRRDVLVPPLDGGFERVGVDADLVRELAHRRRRASSTPAPARRAGRVGRMHGGVLDVLVEDHPHVLGGVVEGDGVVRAERLREVLVGDALVDEPLPVAVRRGSRPWRCGRCPSGRAGCPRTRRRGRAAPAGPRTTSCWRARRRPPSPCGGRRPRCAAGSSGKISRPMKRAHHVVVPLEAAAREHHTLVGADRARWRRRARRARRRPRRRRRRDRVAAAAGLDRDAAVEQALQQRRDERRAAAADVVGLASHDHVEVGRLVAAAGTSRPLPS